MQTIGRRRAFSRLGIAPIIATVLIIVSTIILSAAVTSSIFGLSSSAANTAQVQVTGITVPTEVLLGVSVVVCSPSIGNTFGHSFGGYVALSNTGTVSTRANSLIFSFAGTTVDVIPTGSCNVAPDSTLYLQVIALPVTLIATSGDPYAGYVSMANGAEVLFVGSFVS